MLRTFCKSKIHRAVVTRVNLKYMGSITIDRHLMEAADILPYERVQIGNLSNGSRVETYVIPGRANSGVICINGAAARWAEVGDEVIIISYCLLDDKETGGFKPKIVFVDNKNRIKRIKIG